MRLTIDKNKGLDLQLSLNASSVQRYHRTEREEDRSLDLSLSPPSLQLKEVNNSDSSESSTIGSVDFSKNSTASLGLSTLDLTMSIRALE
jgi:hypothetical protein